MSLYPILLNFFLKKSCRKCFIKILKLYGTNLQKIFKFSKYFSGKTVLKPKIFFSFRETLFQDCFTSDLVTGKCCFYSVFFIILRWKQHRKSCNEKPKRGLRLGSLRKSNQQPRIWRKEVRQSNPQVRIWQKKVQQTNLQLQIRQKEFRLSD